MSRPSLIPVRIVALGLTVLLALGVFGLAAHAGEAARSAASHATDASTAPTDQSTAPGGTAAGGSDTSAGAEHADQSEDASEDPDDAPDAKSTRGAEVVAVGGDAVLAPGDRADQVVAVFGSATSDGEVKGEVVSVFGDTQVKGHTGGNAIAVFGDNRIDARVDGQAIAVAGDLELGPRAEIGGDVIVVGGTLHRSPQAVIHGQLRQVGGVLSGGSHGLNTWLRTCLVYGRLLGFSAQLAWAWVLALTLVLLYVALAVLFHEPWERCVQLLEARPGHALLAGLLSLLLAPLVFVLLTITVVGALAVPLLIAGWLCAALFGKAVVLGSLGRRGVGLFRDASAPLHPGLAVLLGGLIVLLLYTVPVLGMIVFNLLGLFGLGIAIYALIVASQRAAAARSAAARAAPPTASSHVDGTASTSQATATAAAAPGARVDTMGVAGAAGTAPAPDAAASATVDPTAPGAAPELAGSPPAGFWIRMGALLIDIILVSALWHLLLGHDGGLHSGGLPLIVLALYGAILWKLKGTTVGGLVFDLKVVRADGQEMDWTTAIVRALACFLSLIVAGLGFFWIAFDPRHQAWHDKIAGTLVVRSRAHALHA